jgi:hypothetical protein
MSPIKRAISEQVDDVDAVSSLSPKRLRGGGFHDDDFGEDDNNDGNLYDEDMLMEHDSDIQNAIPDEVLEEAAKAFTEKDQQRWKRPDLPSDFSSDADLDMLWIEMDIVTGKPLEKNPNSNRSDVVGSSDKAVPVLRTYGVTESGHSVAAFIHGFTPYGYFSLPPGYILANPQSNLDAIRDALNVRLLKERSANNLRYGYEIDVRI